MRESASFRSTEFELSVITAGDALGTTDVRGAGSDCVLTGARLRLTDHALMQAIAIPPGPRTPTASARANPQRIMGADCECRQHTGMQSRTAGSYSPRTSAREHAGPFIARLIRSQGQAPPMADDSIFGQSQSQPAGG